MGNIIQRPVDEDMVEYAKTPAPDLNEVKAQLAQMTAQVDIMKQFPKQGNESDDTARFQRAVDYAIANNKTITADKSQTFIISSPINIDYFVDMDLGGATIKANGNLPSVFHFNYHNGETVVNENLTSRISNIDFDCGSAAIVIHGEYIRKTEFVSIKLRNLVGKGIKIDAGYQILCDKWDIVASGTSSVGIEINTSDCHFNEFIMLGCHTGIINAGANFYKLIHAWLLKPNTENSVFFDSVRGNVMLEGCTCDTYYIGIKKRDGGKLGLSQFKFMINTFNFIPTTAYAFYFEATGEESIIDYSRYVLISNSIFLGQSGITTYFSNLNTSDCRIRGIHNSNDYAYITGVDQVGVSTITLNATNFRLGNQATDKTYNRLTRKGNRVLCEFKLNGAIALNAGTQYEIGTFPENYKPISDKIVPVLVSNDAWGASYVAGFLYVTANNLTLRFSGAITGYFVSCSFEYDILFDK